MINKLIQDIEKYIEYLKSKGFYITIHGLNQGVFFDLIKYNFHENAFCSLVKSENEAWRKCICMQRKIYERNNKEPFFGMCHAGVEEYIFYVNEKMFVSISGYGIHYDEAIKRINRVSKEFLIDKNALIKAYENGLMHEKCDMEYLKIIINPLCYMLNLLTIIQPEEKMKNEKNELYNSIKNYILQNFMNNITDKDIATACSCSVSSVCHIFKKYEDISVQEYVSELRIKQACKLLKNSNLSIGTIAAMCGYSDSNYFSVKFKKIVGCTPSEYRVHN